MPTPYSSDDLGRVFDARTLTRGRTLVLFGAVEVTLAGDTVSAAVDDLGVRQTASMTPAAMGGRVVFNSRCSCRHPGCVHLAAMSLAALDRFPVLRKAEQKGLLSLLSAAPAPDRQRLVFELAPGAPPHACFVTASLVSQQSGRIEPTTPARILADPSSGAPAREVARALGGEANRTGVTMTALPVVLGLLAKSGLARWSATGRQLISGVERIFDADTPPKLPAKSAVLLGEGGPWYVDASTGALGRVRLRQKQRPALVHTRPRRRRIESVGAATESDRMIVEHAATPVLRLRKLQCPDEFGRLQMLDALTLDFDYGGVIVGAEDERQFVRVEGPAGPSFVRRDTTTEAAAFGMLRQDGFVQMRVADGRNAKGRRVLVFRGPEAAENWHRFVAGRVPALEAQGWRSLIDADFGPRMVDRVGTFDVQVSDIQNSEAGQNGEAGTGRFSLDFGIEIDGVRHPLLPILSHLLERGGIDAAQVVGDELVTSLPDGRVVKLPAERIGRLLAIMGDLIDAADRSITDQLVLPDAEASAVLELEDLLATRWHNAGAIQAYAQRFREAPEIEAGDPAGQLQGGAAPLSAAGRRLAAASERPRPERLPGRRHGAGQDRADHRPYRHRARRRPARPPGAGRGADQPDQQLDGGTDQVRPAPARGGAARPRPA